MNDRALHECNCDQCLGNEPVSSTVQDTSEVVRKSFFLTVCVEAYDMEEAFDMLPEEFEYLHIEEVE